MRFADPDAQRIAPRTLSLAVAAFIFVTSWVVAIVNPSILSLIADPTRARVLYALDLVEELCGSLST